MSVYLLLSLLTVVATFYDLVAFSLSRCVKLLGNANEFDRLFYALVVTHLPDTHNEDNTDFNAA